MTEPDIDPRVLQHTTDSDKFRSAISDDNDMIANKYNSVTIVTKAFISWKRYRYV